MFCETGVNFFMIQKGFHNFFSVHIKLKASLYKTSHLKEEHA